MFIYLRILRAITKFSIKDDLTYRLDFISKIVQELAWILAYIVFFEVIFAYVDSLGDWGKFEVILLYGTYRVSQQIVYILTASLYNFNKLIESGEFDFILTKPIDAQFYSSVRKIRVVSIISLVANMIIVVYAATRIGIQSTPYTLIVYIMMVMSSGVILYSFYLAAATLNFWFTRVNNLPYLLHGIEAIGRLPVDAFSRNVRLFFTFFIPLIFLATVPARVLLGKSTGFLVPLSFIVSIIVTLLGRRFWNHAIKNYTSAGG